MPGAPFLEPAPESSLSPERAAVLRAAIEHASILQRDDRLAEAHAAWTGLHSDITERLDAAERDPLLLLLYRVAVRAWPEELVESSGRILDATLHRLSAIDDQRAAVARFPGHAASWCNLGDALARHAEHLRRADCEDAAATMRRHAIAAWREVVDHAAPASRIGERARLALETDRRD